MQSCLCGFLVHDLLHLVHVQVYFRQAITKKNRPLALLCFLPQQPCPVQHDVQDWDNGVPSILLCCNQYIKETAFDRYNVDTNSTDATQIQNYSRHFQAVCFVKNVTRVASETG